LVAELQDVTAEVERANAEVGSLDKRVKLSERALIDAKSKLDSALVENEASQKEALKFASDLAQLKLQFQDLQDLLSASRNEGKRLSEELKDCAEQLVSSFKSTSDSEKARKRAGSRT